MAQKRFYKYSTEEDYQKDVGSLPVPHIAKVVDDIRFKTELDEPYVECVFDCNRGTNQILSSNSSFRIDTISKTYVNGELLEEPVRTIDVGYNQKCVVRVYFTSSTVSIYVFYGCSSLTNIVIPDSVTRIGASVFNGCSSLTSIVIPDSVISIGESAFSRCSSLTNVVIPDSVTGIGDYAFNNCSKLASIIVSSNNTIFDSRNNCNAIIRTSNNTLIVGCRNTIIPDSVTSIGSYAFSGCSSLTNVVIPDSVTSISSFAFSNCSSLTNVEYSDTIEQWKAISKGPFWRNAVPNTCIIHCTDGDISITES